MAHQSHSKTCTEQTSGANKTKEKEKRKNIMKNQTMKIYTVYLEDGENCYKLTIPAFTKEQAIQYTAGNGEVIAIKENKNIVRAFNACASFFVCKVPDNC